MILKIFIGMQEKPIRVQEELILLKFQKYFIHKSIKNYFSIATYCDLFQIPLLQNSPSNIPIKAL